MKTVKLLAIVLTSTAFLTACGNAGRDDRHDRDTLDVDPQMEPAPPIDTLRQDTAIIDTL